MQVHHQPRAAPALALAGKNWSKKRMQTHAPDACAAKTAKNSL
ncbi:acetyl xylan esterase [Enterobacter hormaechei]|nr:acetyl xylan esterase [Enterobacter hormaechei]RTP38341.1 acetyl xylan esterase [Enterobacter hormaechei]URL72992.1 acetyl xylan esterase [Enterobacter hormaechei]